MFSRLIFPTAPRALCRFLVLAASGQLVCSSPSGTAAEPVPQARIDEAVRRGCKALLPRVKRLATEPPGDYPMGRLALTLAAVLKARTPSADPVVKAALERLATLPPRKTYSVACYLFALDAYWNQLHRESLSAAARGRPRGLRAQGEILDRMRELSHWLVEARVEGQGVWTYDAAERGARKHDYSNMQFAVLGLRVALQHGIDVPPLVFTEIAAQLVRSQVTGATGETRLSRVPDLADLLLDKRLPARIHRDRAGGWDYTARRKEPYASMTAAGASSLLVALEKLPGGERRLRARAEQALSRAYVWIASHFDRFITSDYKNYYTLYSLEKVGDLARIGSFGDRDWYQEGARHLLARQRKNGSWGSYVHTSFALFFLTRATRLGAAGTPQIRTGGGKKNTTFPRHLVHVSRVNGFLPATEVLMLLADHRERELIRVGSEVVRNYGARFRGDLVPVLVLLGEKSDRVGRFARDSLSEITGERFPDARRYMEWYRRYREIERLAAAPTASGQRVAQLLGSATGTVLKGHLLDVVQKHRLAGLSGRLVPEMTQGTNAYRWRLHRLLNFLNKHEMEGPSGETPEAWRRLAERWRAWLGENPPVTPEG